MGAVVTVGAAGVDETASPLAGPKTHSASTVATKDGGNGRLKRAMSASLLVGVVGAGQAPRRVEAARQSVRRLEIRIAVHGGWQAGMMQKEKGNGASAAPPSTSKRRRARNGFLVHCLKSWRAGRVKPSACAALRGGVGTVQYQGLYLTYLNQTSATCDRAVAA